MKIKNIKQILEKWKERGLVKDIINEDKIEYPIGVYLGIDPTADSLHIGHLVPLKLLKELENIGMTPMILIGETTALIGDPSFKEIRYNYTSENTTKKYVTKIKKQLEKILPGAVIVNNKIWYDKTTFVHFLRKVGTFPTVNYMLQKKSYKQDNLKYSNFSYILMQAYDFYKMYKSYNIRGQIGGSDQTPNIAMGVKYLDWISTSIRKWGITTNLLTDKKGLKMSKTAKQTIWLDPNKTSIYEMYQYIFNLNDKLAKQWLRVFDLDISDEEIDKFLEPEVKKTRALQKALFKVISEWIYKEEELKDFKRTNMDRISWMLRDKDPKQIRDFQDFFAPIPIDIEREASGDEEGCNLVYLLERYKLADSYTKARDLITQRGIKVNHEIICDYEHKIKKSDFVNGYLLIQKGKKTLKLFRLEKWYNINY